MKQKELSSKKNEAKIPIPVRAGIKDIAIWNAFMVNGAQFSEHDIPYCPTTAKALPKAIITYEEARHIYRQKLTNHENSFFVDAFIIFCCDDYKFDNKNGIWLSWNYALRILKHFRGIISPDFSTCQDFPDPLKRFNTYRMRAFGYWYGVIIGGEVYNNVRWGTPETYEYCFDGLPENDILVIGTVASGLRKLLNRPTFDNGIREMYRRLHPHTIIVYGSANYSIFEWLKEQGVHIVVYPSKISEDFRRRADHE